MHRHGEEKDSVTGWCALSDIDWFVWLIILHPSQTLEELILALTEYNQRPHLKDYDSWEGIVVAFHSSAAVLTFAFTYGLLVTYWNSTRFVYGLKQFVRYTRTRYCIPSRVVIPRNLPHQKYTTPLSSYHAPFIITRPFHHNTPLSS